MKIKTRIKSFWRHNNYFSAIMTIVTLLIAILNCIIGMPMPEIINGFVITALWSLVWIYERRADFYRRMQWVILHKALWASSYATVELITRDYNLTPKTNEKED